MDDFSPEVPASLAAVATSDESRRLAILRCLGILDSEREPAFDGLVECAARALGTPIALVSLIDAQRQWFKAAFGLAARETPREQAFCAHAIHAAQLLEVEDASTDPRFATNPLVTGAPHVRFYAGQPLAVGGVNVGTLCVIDTRPRRLDDDQRRLLRQLAAAASELMAGRLRILELHDEQQRQHDFARAASDWQWECDADLICRFVAGEGGVFAPTPEAVGQPLTDAALLDAQGHPQPGGWRRWLTAQRAAFSRLVIEMPGPDRPRHISCSAVPIWGADSRFLGWRGTARDVSVVSSSDLWSRRQQLLLAEITAHVPGVIFRARRRPDGLPQFLYLSPAAPLLFGFDPEAACADPRLVIDRVHREDLPLVLEQFAVATRDQRPWRSEYRMVMPGRLVRWVETRALPTPGRDGLTWNGYTADITERKQAELALRQAEQTWEMAAAADGIGLARVDLASGRLSLDARACAIHGLAYPQPELTLEDWIESMEPSDRQPAAQALRRAIERREPVRALVRLRWPDGTLRNLEFAVAASSDAAGAVVALAGTCRDITERLSIEHLKRDKEAADRASRAKSEFLSRVSHELRTPLNSILGFTQLLALDTEHPLQEHQQRQMLTVQHAGRHLLGLIDDLLDLSRAEAKDAALEISTLDLGATLGVCLDLLAPQAQRAGVGLPDAPPGVIAVHANPRALEQVLMNLLSNAIKYNRRGGRVEVDVHAQGGRVTLSIRDQGQGLSEQQRERLFQPFDRLGAEHGPVQGSGLGLVIARDLVLAMGGTLEASSEPGVGSTFTVVLEAGEAGAVTAPQPFDDTIRDLQADFADSARRVLYVEDDPLNVLLMEEVIRRAPPWQMTVADSGAEGLRLAREQLPELVLLDINLPDLSGIEIVAALRADPATAYLRCIALSADAMREQVDEAMAAGFDDYWLKPVDVVAMIERLARLRAPSSRDGERGTRELQPCLPGGAGPG